MSQTTTSPVVAKNGKSWLDFFKPSAAAEVRITDPAEVQRGYVRWQIRIMIGCLVGYAMFYFVRKNLSPAMAGPEGLLKSLGMTKSQFGTFLTLHGLVYGFSKFINGFIADRANAARFMTLALVLSAGVNIWFGLSSTLWVLGTLWVLNGWIQGMGFPPIARLMTHWFSPKELATKMSIWNTSHSIGAGLVTLMCGYLVEVNWRLCFLVPAGFALLFAFFMPRLLRDSPQEVGLPELPGTERTEQEGKGETDTPEFKAFVKRQVFQNKYIWLLALANFFVYVIRFGIFDWGMIMLTEAKGARVTHAAWVVFGFEVSGVIGMLLSGWLTDRIFGGRCARMCMFCMALAGLSIFAFWKIPTHSALLGATALCFGGFFIYAPQALIGIASANLATKRAAATAVGFTGLFGYLSSVVSGWGFGKLVQKHGWDAGLLLLIGCAAVGTVLFALAWGAKASGYAEEKPA
jgi:sugar phosphate permease